MKHKFLYVAAAMNLGQYFGKIMKALKKELLIMLMLITADHALYYPKVLEKN